MIPDSGRADPALASLRDLLRQLGHDLNNHLASIIVNLSLASATSTTEADRQTQLHEALDSARQAAQLARHLFAAGNAQSAEGSIELQGSDEAEDVDQPADAATGAPADDDRQASAGATDASAATGSLLVLEDDESVATMMRDVLKHFGYDVAVTQSPEACLTLYERARRTSRPFDLVILDLTIRGGARRGMETLSALRQIDPQIRAVAHSGDPEAEVMKDPRRYGFIAAIRKPTPLAQLSRIVQDLMARKA